MYVRINKNRVRAFQGPSVDADQWDRAFSHYFNLLASQELCRLGKWCESNSIPTPNLDVVGDSLCVAASRDCDELNRNITRSLVALETWVNNPSEQTKPLFSMPESPLKYFCEAMSECGALQGKIVFVCIDEYENLLDYQQARLNTYLKHAEPPLSYKIGVKKNGLRTRATIDLADIITAPEDYNEIDIGVDTTDDFVKQVVEHRLELAKQRGVDITTDAEEFLPELPIADEAEALGCLAIANDILLAIAEVDDAPLLEWAQGIPKTSLYLAKYWAEGEKTDVVAQVRDWKSKPSVWSTRLGNYGYASLFWLSKGRKGARIRKYYAGFRTVAALASGNVRYLIELIDESLQAEGGEGDEWGGFVTPKCQTLAARAVGRRRLEQLESVTEHGASIKRVVLGLGKVFFEIARDPVGRAPEQNAFVVAGEHSEQLKLLELLQQGVAHLALEATPRTKATTQSEMKDDEFRLHPIFAPFFEFSHRKKRRITFQAEDLLELLVHPSKAISKLLTERAQTPLEELPQQLALFSSFYGPGPKP
nr:hypothetical protein [Kofleriaceae bacterium]